jgi:hypothetical protein
MITLDLVGGIKEALIFKQRLMRAQRKFDT